MSYRPDLGDKRCGSEIVHPPECKCLSCEVALLREQKRRLLEACDRLLGMHRSEADVVFVRDAIAYAEKEKP